MNDFSIEQVERIKRMELHLERTTNVVKALSDALEGYEAAKKAIDELETYYGSSLWKQDLEADEQGLLPKELKRGVLSQDAIWNVLEELSEVKNKMKEL